ncbi:hypothetical protein BC628DRAFT_1418981 [Trametes gibbosa]|nr:hypothetical protein BC628DRAFT_1418981 [Trametes gibbosa]
MHPHIPRSDPAPDPSSPHEQCNVIAPSVRLCPADIAAIAAVALFICYIVWGIPLTIRAIRSLHAKFSCGRTGHNIPVYLADDLEKGVEIHDDDHRNSKSPVDPYLSPTKRLRSFILVSGKVAHPEPAYIPETDHGEQQSERERLDSFKYPRASMIALLFSPSRPSALRMPESPSASSVSGLYSPSSRSTVFQHDEPLSPASACFPTPPGLASPSTLVSPDLNATDRLDPLPSLPPPAYLDEHPEQGLKSVCKPCSW